MLVNDAVDDVSGSPFDGGLLWRLFASLCCELMEGLLLLLVEELKLS